MTWDKFPFVSYEFWAYLAAGFPLLFVADQAFDTGWLARGGPWVETVMAITCAYAAGHLIAGFSAALFETLLVEKLLGHPCDVLLGVSRVRPWVQRVLPVYFVPLPEATRKAVLDKGAKLGVAVAGDALFGAAYVYVRESPLIMSRLDDLMNRYGFCRSIALVAWADAVLFCIAYGPGGRSPIYLTLAGAAWLVGCGMALCYLKFFRQYGLEVLTSFAYAKRGA